MDDIHRIGVFVSFAAEKTEKNITLRFSRTITTAAHITSVYASIYIYIY
jgi:hypothetical protein